MAKVGHHTDPFRVEKIVKYNFLNYATSVLTQPPTLPQTKARGVTSHLKRTNIGSKISHQVVKSRPSKVCIYA